jgi:hypothetical protein
MIGLTRAGWWATSDGLGLRGRPAGALRRRERLRAGLRLQACSASASGDLPRRLPEGQVCSWQACRTPPDAGAAAGADGSAPAQYDDAGRPVVAEGDGGTAPGSDGDGGGGAGSSVDAGTSLRGPGGLRLQRRRGPGAALAACWAPGTLGGAEALADPVRRRSGEAKRRTEVRDGRHGPYRGEVFDAWSVRRGGGRPGDAGGLRLRRRRDERRGGQAGGSRRGSSTSARSAASPRSGRRRLLATQVVHLANQGNALAYVNKVAIEPAEPQFTFERARPRVAGGGETAEIELRSRDGHGNQTATLWWRARRRSRAGR